MASIDSYAPSRALRASLFVGHPARGATHDSVPPLAFALTFLAVMASFTISGNTLTVLGTHYAEPGGNPLLKIHPATYLAVVAAIASLISGSAAQSRLGYIFGKAPALFFFIGFTIFCAAFSAVNVGITNGGVYVDNYLSAGAIAAAALFQNIAALRLNISKYQSAEVLCYTTLGDGGGGWYTYVSSDTTSADNGGTIIVDAAGHRWYLEPF